MAISRLALELDSEWDSVEGARILGAGAAERIR